jgi:hypothetical protein
MSMRNAAHPRNFDVMTKVKKTDREIAATILAYCIASN